MMNTDRSPIFGILTNPSLMDFPGCIAAVMFTTGCNFSCGFCHNASLLGAPREGYTWDRLDEICRQFKANWVKGIVITGGEPTLAGNLLETIHFLRKRGFAIKIDTNGSRPAVLRKVLPLVDYVAMDIKCSLARYPAFVQFCDLDAIRQSIQMILAGSTTYEFRTTVIEGIHSKDEMREIGAMIRGAQRYVLQAFLPRENLPDPVLRTKQRTTPALLRCLAVIAKDFVEETIIRGD